MTIKTGDKLPSVTFKQFTKDGFADISTDTFFADKRTLLFGIPGAFTPICQGNHVPGYLQYYDELVSRGIDQIACISVNDCFVMKAFGEAQNADGKIAMLADDSARFTSEIGLDTDASSFGLGKRSERYAMVVVDGVVEKLLVETNFVDHNKSSAENMLKEI
jgi:peroxiredoxin